MESEQLFKEFKGPDKDFVEKKKNELIGKLKQNKEWQRWNDSFIIPDERLRKILNDILVEKFDESFCSKEELEKDIIEAVKKEKDQENIADIEKKFRESGLDYEKIKKGTEAQEAEEEEHKNPGGD